MEVEDHKEEHFTVAVRVRPFITREIESAAKVGWELPGPTSIKETNGERMFIYDNVFDQSTSTQILYEEICEKLVWKSLEGYNGCIFCYGQTGSGKTFTMQGSRKDSPGIVPLSIDSIFTYIQQTPDKSFLLRCSYLEVYNECVNDLLNPSLLNLQIQEDKQSGVKVVGATETVCTSISQVNSLLYLGETHKQIASTNFNMRSSRSHTIFRMIIESKSRSEADNCLNVATLNLIDLAGSEGANVHGPTASAHRTREMSFINKSLLTLSTVIMRLSDRTSNTPIPYRDSKLTRLLQPSLQGESKVVIICNISPSLDSYEESLSTLKFAQRAKKIKQIIVKNEIHDSKALIVKYEHEIKTLQEKLRDMETKLFEESESQDYNDTVVKMELKLSTIQEEKDQLDTKMESLMQDKLEMQSELERLRSMILVSENVKINPESNDAEQFTENNSKLNDRRRVRLSVMRESVSGSSQSIARVSYRPSEILLKSGSDIESRFRKFPTIDESKVPDISDSGEFRETMLLDKLDNLKELLESEEPLERMSMMLTPQDIQEAREFIRHSDAHEKKEEPQIDFIAIIQEQDGIIQSLQGVIEEKDEQVALLKDELELCRANLARIQKQLKEMKNK
ncbi:unnamed protein product [Blepharisma stoltei]|uniref:Kinesin-like protein n=1 Tax=Blepharisma stoltei TaxID=1481888 RepID=A0AAU9KFD1_9CILI|nr:unnamed protein product [Blepharisma stoltei]